MSLLELVQRSLRPTRRCRGAARSRRRRSWRVVAASAGTGDADRAGGGRRRCSGNTTRSATSPPISCTPTRAASLQRKREERGTLLVKKPGKMRWNYKAPDEKVFVSDGVRLYPVLSRREPGRSSARSPTRIRPARAVPRRQGQPHARLQRQLRPGRRRRHAGRCGSTRSSRSRTTTGSRSRPRATRSQLRSLTVAEKQGSRSTFAFTNFKENPGLADKTFEFTIPRGRGGHQCRTGQALSDGACDVRARRRAWPLASGCATRRAALRAGERAEAAKDYDRAVVEYTKALRANPDDDNARLALERAKLRASQEHAFRGAHARRRRALRGGARSSISSRRS